MGNKHTTALQNVPRNIVTIVLMHKINITSREEDSRCAENSITPNGVPPPPHPGALSRL